MVTIKNGGTTIGNSIGYTDIYGRFVVNGDDIGAGTYTAVVEDPPNTQASQPEVSSLLTDSNDFNVDDPPANTANLTVDELVRNISITYTLSGSSTTVTTTSTTSSTAGSTTSTTSTSTSTSTTTSTSTSTTTSTSTSTSTSTTTSTTTTTS